MSEAAYYRQMTKALAEAGLYKPTLVIDRDRLDANVARIMNQLDQGLALRIVDKSLPVPHLLERILNQTGARRLMSFHWPITLAMLEAFPDVTLLQGKPLPVAMLEAILATASNDLRQTISQRVTLLVDSLDRLEGIIALAARIDCTFDIALEVNIGMNRGGFEHPAALKEAISKARQAPKVRISGIMGYEAHIPAIPHWLGGPAKAKAKADARYAAFAACLGPDERSILNTGGSKTALGYGPGHLANEVSIGSAFLLPSDFDGGFLTDCKPALFIATPVLKSGPARMPGLDGLTPIFQTFGLFPRHGVFIYGGKWMADPVWPKSLKTSSIWGQSSNQQFFGVDAEECPAPDDFVVFRPTQSEAILSQFGAIAILAGDRIVESWEPLLPG